MINKTNLQIQKRKEREASCKLEKGGGGEEKERFGPRHGAESVSSGRHVLKSHINSVISSFKSEERYKPVGRIQERGSRYKMKSGKSGGKGEGDTEGERERERLEDRSVPPRAWWKRRR